VTTVTLGSRLFFILLQINLLFFSVTFQLVQQGKTSPTLIYTSYLWLPLYRFIINFSSHQHTLIEEAMQCPSFFLVLKLTNNIKQICCTALTIQKEFFTTPLPTRHRDATSERGGGEELRLQSQGGQDLCTAAAAEHLIFKTSTEEHTVDLTNKDMTKDSQRFSRWFHSVWRTTGQY
jgi:hypothetical protein